MTWLKGKAGPELKKRAREQRRPLLKTVVSSAQVLMMLASEQYEYQNPFTSKGFSCRRGRSRYCLANRPETHHPPRLKRTLKPITIPNLLISRALSLSSYTVLTMKLSHRSDTNHGTCLLYLVVLLPLPLFRFVVLV
jgi:hypothetical protein